MATRAEPTTHRFGLVPGRTAWPLVLVFTLAAVVSVVVLAVVSYRAASGIFREQALQQLRTLRISVGRSLERHFDHVEADVVTLARDPSTLLAVKQLSAATAQLDEDARTEPAKMRPQMEDLKHFLEDYYREELGKKVLDLRSLLLPQRSAVWLQAAYLAHSVDSNTTQYALSHATWDAAFRSTSKRRDFDDLYLIDASSGRIVYSIRKRPDFQSSLLDGPYAEGPIGALFRQIRSTGNDPGYRLTDFAPYPPAHGMPAAFAGAPIVNDGQTVGALIVQLSSEPLKHILTADGLWAQIGLGDTGDLYLVGRGDGDLLMRSASRFGALAAPAPATSAALETTILRQRVESPATSATNRADEYQSEYINYRGASVLGSAGWLSAPKGLNWTLIAEIGSTEALRPLHELRARIAWIAGVVFVGVLVLGIGVTMAIASSPRAPAGATTLAADAYQQRLEAVLRPVATAVTAASEGDLSQRIALDGHALGDLPHALNRMWRTVAALISHVRSSSTAAIDSTTQIQTVVRQLSQDAVRDTAECMGTNTVVRDIRSRLGTLAADSATAGHAEQAGAATVQQSAAAVALLLTGMEELQNNAQTLTLKMKRLGERSMEISAVTRTIQEITAEANMLALNATIEASRAGEHGIGFKVVASNIRKLAVRTDAAAKDTTELVTALHGEAADAVDCIEQQTEQTERQVSIITRSAYALTRCHEALGANAERVVAISAAIEEQAGAAERVGETLLGIAGFIRRAHVLSEQAIHSSAALLSMLSELNTWAQTLRVRPEGGVSAPSSNKTEVIELSSHDAVGNGRRIGV